VKKTTYKTIMWSIVTVLALLLLFFIYKFKNSHTVTKHAGLKLAETEAAFEAHRQKTLDRDSELRRKLQDEINKNRKTEP
ncbi:MAG: tRNA (guanine-N1)-methyltransferase, partial [Marinirhabdus sp.]